MAEIAPVPLPPDVPFEGPEGTDADGYPTKVVSQASLRSLLHHKKYTELTRYFEQYQSEFEADPRKEYWPLDAGDAFASAEPELQAALDAWVAASPTSFAPYLARGAYLTNRGFTLRGTKFAKDTHSSDFDAMRAAQAAALVDLDHALELRHKLVAAVRYKIKIHSGAGVPISKDIELATTMCPSCFQVRVTALHSMRPRWGGSHAKMLALARAAPIALNKRFSLLPGYVEFDKAAGFSDARRYDQALAELDRACAHGEHWEFLLERSEVQRWRNDLEAAWRDVERANELRPYHPAILFERASQSDHRADWEASGRDLRAGLRIDPTNAKARPLVPRAVQGLLYKASIAAKVGQSKDALRMLELASELDPLNKTIGQWRTAVVEGTVGELPPITESVASLEERVASSPNDFDAHRALDYALARQGNYARVVSMWNDFIARHPEEGRAYLERGGAHYHLGKVDEARADATKACELGVSEGCARAKTIPNRR